MLSRVIEPLYVLTTDIHPRWSNAAYVLNEVKNPVHTLKIAGPLGLLICGVLYLLANVAYFSAATPQEIANSGSTVAAYFMLKVFGKAAQRALRYVRHLPQRLPISGLTAAKASLSRYPP